MTDLSLNRDGTITVYSGGKKIMKGTVAEVVAVISGHTAEKSRRERPRSRTQRWQDAASALESAAQDLQSIQEEYQEWRDSLPENLESSAVAEKLDEVLALDIDSVVDTASEASGLDLPLGFGRD